MNPSDAPKGESDPRYEVRPYSIATLKKTLAWAADTDIANVESKAHCVYFEEYFRIIGASTMIVEKCYVDHYFMDDYAGYYVCCFKEYDRCCTRLHFFSENFDDKAVEAILEGNPTTMSQECFEESYLGFVVVKPLPKTIIGRTCLKTFPDDDGRRNYPITRTYRVNLFGVNLKVESLAFQEQDKVVAACSTSALWSVLQGTGKIFHHHIPSPVEITRLATEHSPPVPPETRPLPNNGLTVTQIAHAIKSLGLAPFFINPGNAHLLKKNVYGYLGCHIPMLMTIALVDFCGTEKKIARMRRGTHAVAITGYSLGDRKTIPFRMRDETHDYLSQASAIDKFYVHDDQVGPFVRMEFINEPIEFDTPEGQRRSVDYSLTTSWRCSMGKTGYVRAIPLALMVPLVHKIRIPYAVVMEAVIALNRTIQVMRHAESDFLPEGLEWNIHLTTINEYKSKVRGMDHLRWDVRRSVLLKEMPRFLWRATAYSGKREVLDLLFDATDIEQACILTHAVPFDEDLYEVLKALPHEPDLQSSLKASPEWKILEWFSNGGTRRSSRMKKLGSVLLCLTSLLEHFSDQIPSIAQAIC